MTEEPGDEDPEEPGDEDQEVDLNLELGVNEAYPGDTVEVSGSGFTANGTVEFSINPALGDVDADDDGAFATEVTSQRTLIQDSTISRHTMPKLIRTSKLTSLFLTKQMKQ